MPEISRSERLLNLVSCLLKASRPVPWSRIRASVAGYRESEKPLASLERRFERDKAALRELGVPVRFVDDTECDVMGYTIPRDAYFLPRFDVTQAEAALLAGIGRFALEGIAGPMSGAVRSALLKLQFDSPFAPDLRDRGQEHFLLCRESGAAEDYCAVNLREITAAVLHRRTIVFVYRGLNRERARRRTVEPYGVGYSAGHWYFVGRDRSRKDIRVFRVDRVRGEIERLRDSGGTDFAPPRGFRVQDYIGTPPWLFGQKQRVCVRIRIDAEVAFMVRMRPSSGDTWEMQPDGSGVLTRVATDLQALTHWVLGLGRHAEVLGPEEFRLRVADALRSLVAQHELRPRAEAAR